MYVAEGIKIDFTIKQKRGIIFFLLISKYTKKTISLSSCQQQQQQHSRAKTPTSTTGGSTWQLCYVTERILAAVLPAKVRIDELFAYDENGNRRSDKFETDLVLMLEQKHGKNFRLFDLESCIPTISLEKLCELCKHIETWLSSGANKIVVLQDR